MCEREPENHMSHICVRERKSVCLCKMLVRERGRVGERENEREIRSH